eukprot:734483-Alexandrium_andersonii.AAC.1
MSASLVGSEMCIRDSPTPRTRTLTEATQGGLKLPPRPQTHRARSPPCACLLYTSDAADDM